MGEERCLFQDFMGGFPLWPRMSGASQVAFPHKVVQGLALNGHLGEGFPKAADCSDLEYCSLQPSLFPSRPLCPAHLSFHPMTQEMWAGSLGWEDPLCLGRKT